MDLSSAAFLSALVVGVSFHTDFADIGELFVLLRFAEGNSRIVADSVYFIVHESTVDMNEVVAA